MEGQRTSLSPCPRCGGKRTWAWLARRLQGLPIELRSEGRWTVKSTDVNAAVCIDCGYTELYAMHPAKLAPDSD